MTINAVTQQEESSDTVLVTSAAAAGCTMDSNNAMNMTDTEKTALKGSDAVSAAASSSLLASCTAGNGSVLETRKADQQFHIKFQKLDTEESDEKTEDASAGDESELNPFESRVVNIIDPTGEKSKATEKSEEEGEFASSSFQVRFGVLDGKEQTDDPLTSPAPVNVELIGVQRRPAFYSSALESIFACCHRLLVRLSTFQSFLVYFSLFLSQLSWSGMHVMAKLGVDYISPFVLPFFRCLLCTAVMLPFMYYNDSHWKTIRSAFNFSDKDSRKLFYTFAAVGFLGAFVNGVFFAWAEQLTDASLVGVMQPVIPVLTALVSVILKIEKFSWIRTLGICIAISGSIIVVLAESLLGSSSSSSDSSSSSSTSSHTAGIFVILAQCTGFSIYVLAQKPLAARIHPFVITFFVFFFGIGYTFILALFFIFTSCFSSSCVPPIAWIAVVYIAVIGSIAAYSLFSYASRHLPASIASLSITQAPFLSSMLGWMFLGEALTWLHFVGALAIVGGAVVVVYGRHRELLKDKLAKQKLEEEQHPANQNLQEGRAIENPSDNRIDGESVESQFNFRSLAYQPDADDNAALVSADSHNVGVPHTDRDNDNDNERKADELALQKLDTGAPLDPSEEPIPDNI